MARNSDSATDGELPLDSDEIPDRWEISHDPTNTDSEAVVLEYRSEQDDAEPAATISLQTSKTPRGPEEGYAVEVQDKDADGAAMNYLNPLAVWEPHETHAHAIDHLYQLAKEYPLEVEQR